MFDYVENCNYNKKKMTRILHGSYWFLRRDKIDNGYWESASTDRSGVGGICCGD